MRPIELKAQPFDLADVRLLDGSLLARQERNRTYLLELDPSRLLHNFRVNAGLPSSAQPLGGWEAPGHGLRGHFVGHFLSACGQMHLTTGDAALKDRVDLLVRGLAECQAALGGEYVAAFPEADLDEIETRFEGAWASYYVLHKLLAGLVDARRYCGNDQALDMAVRLASYVRKRLDKLSPDRLEKMLRTDKPNPTNETGGWAETLRDLYAITGDPEHLSLARHFEPGWFVIPLIRGEDRLTGLHANTHIPIALGLARRSELTDDPQLRAAVMYFWDRTALARSYVNGGSSGPRPDGLEKSKGGEHWPEADKLAGTLTPKINESCVTHNMMRLTDALFRWTADVRYADFFERAYFNSVLCMQHPEYPGGYIYDHPLGGRSQKVFGHADDTFWCCYGSTIEAYSRLQSGIYYRSTHHCDDMLWVNLPVASELTWKEKGLRIEQRTCFPLEDTTRLIFRCATAVELTVNVRVPFWVAGVPRLSVNGKSLDLSSASPGSFVPVRRAWREGDVLEATFPMGLHAEPMPDDERLIAFLYGPLVLAAKTDAELVLEADDAASAVALVRPAPGRRLTFQTRLACGADATLVPLNQIVDEKFGVYLRLQRL